MVDDVLFVAEIGVVLFVEFRIDVIAQLLCERYRNVWLGDFLLVFCAILSDPDLVFLRKDEKKFQGWLVHSSVFWATGGVTCCSDCGRYRHLLIPATCWAALTGLAFVMVCFLCISSFFVIPLCLLVCPACVSLRWGWLLHVYSECVFSVARLCVHTEVNVM